MSMHPLFADWYRIVTVELDEEILVKRWEGIEEAIKSLEADAALDIVRLFSNKPPKNSEFSTSFAEFFKKVDGAFLMRGNELELQILAGATIINCFDTSNDEATNIAYGLICSDFQGVAPIVPIPEIIVHAYNFLREQSNKNRSQNEFTPIQTEVKAEQLTETMQITAREVNALHNSLKIQREQSDILWWLFAEYSNDMKCRMADLKLPAASLIAGKELADLTYFSFSHLASKAFLDRMLRAVKKDISKAINLNDAINATPLPWREQLSKDVDLSGINDLCPIYYAINKSVETKDKSAWTVTFEANTGLKAETSITATKLAMQIFQETLFADFYMESK